MKKYKWGIVFCLFLITNLVIGQNDLTTLLDSTDTFFQKQSINGYINYSEIQKEESINQLIEAYQKINYQSLDDQTRKALLINAYNLKVIQLVIQEYPILSVQSIPRFFLKKEFILDGRKISLNELETEYLLKKYKDPRLHFALVCGAKGCPPIQPSAFHPDRLESQLDEISKAVVNDSYFVRVDENEVYLFKVFDWYKEDFKTNGTTLIEYINQYRSSPLNQNSEIKYRKYDWSLNALVDDLFGGQKAGNNSLRYVVSSTIPKGGWEIKWFNNLYSQTENSNRSTFFTSTLNVLYGLSDRVNLGFTGRLRRVRNKSSDSNAFDLFKSLDPQRDRQELSGIGPMIRWAPITQWSNFSIQSSLLIPLDSDLTGNEFMQPYVDYDHFIWATQFFNDFTLGNKFSLFTEIDFLVEDLGGDTAANRISTPTTLILSYFPFRNATLYGLGSISPYYEKPSDYFYQLGMGAKYQFTPNYEMELLYTHFDNKFLSSVNGTAATYNLGIRYSY